MTSHQDISLTGGVESSRKPTDSETKRDSAPAASNGKRQLGGSEDGAKKTSPENAASEEDEHVEAKAVKRPRGIVSYRSVEPQDWKISTYRNSRGNVQVRVLGQSFNFHHFATDPQDNWSHVPFAVLLQDMEGKNIENPKLSFNITREQAVWIEEVVDTYLIQKLVELSPEYNNNKPLTKERVVAMYKSVVSHQEGRDRLVKMSFVANRAERYLTRYVVFDPKEDGEGWKSTHREPVTFGAEALNDILGEHRLKNAKVRVHAHLSGVNMVGKTLYPKFELDTVFIRMPPTSSPSLSMISMDEDEMKFMAGCD